MSFIETSGRPWRLLLSVLLAMALSVTAASVGARLWARRPNSEDFVFADLMLLGWLRRVRAERRAEEAHRLLGYGMDGQDLSRERCCRVLLRLVAMLEAKDVDTLGHSRRVTRHAERIARDMGLSREDVARVRIAASVHDIGKVHTPRQILEKPGRLTPDEFEIMKRHTIDGARMTAEMADAEITAMVRHHHERLDGSGYPDGLRGEEIPLGARIISVADTFDAITASRTYHGASAHRRALEVVSADAGTRLDPDAVAAFLRYYSGKRAVALSALGFTGTPRLANWAAGAVNGVGAWVSPMVQSFAAIAAAALAGLALEGPAPQATAASNQPIAAAGEPSTPEGGPREPAVRSEAGARGAPRAHLAPVADRPRNRVGAPVGPAPGESAPPGGSSTGDAPSPLPGVDAPAVEAPDVDLPDIDVPVGELPDVALPHVELPLSQLLPGAEDVNVELPELRFDSWSDHAGG